MADTVTKAFRGFEIKDADKGEIQAIIATLGVIDRDGDIIKKGAIPDGAKVAMSAYAHDAVFGSRPVGKGTITIDGAKAIFKGRVFLNTVDGRETFEVLKEMGTDQEWSWGFRVTGWETPSEDEKKQGAWRILTKTEPFEVSPVLIGAGIGTRTVATKSADAQADGDAAMDATFVTQVVTDVVSALAAKRDATIAEAKRLRDAAEAQAAKDAETARLAAQADADRLAAETKAREDAEAATKASELKAKAVDEFERFRKTMHRHRVA